MNYAIQPRDNNGKQHVQIEEYGISYTRISNELIANVGTLMYICICVQQ